MKIIIDNQGKLQIDGKAKRCPMNYPDMCGDWCALFTINKWGDETHYTKVAGVDVGLCHKTYSIPIEYFMDFREKYEGDEVKEAR